MFLAFYILALICPLAILLYLYRKQIHFFKFVILGCTIGVGSYYSCRILSILESNTNFSYQEILNPKSGLTFYGGFLFSFLTLLIFGKSVFKDKNLFEDFFLKSIIVFLIGYAIGRLGCHFSADGCYGKVTFNGMGIRYTWGEYQTLFPVYPTLIYEFILSILLAILLTFLYKIRVNKHHLIITFFLIFPSWRFLLEFIRVNPPFINGYTFNQICSVIISPVLILSYLITIKINLYENHKTISTC